MIIQKGLQSQTTKCGRNLYLRPDFEFPQRNEKPGLPLLPDEVTIARSRAAGNKGTRN